jgi:hypothetical protein
MPQSPWHRRPCAVPEPATSLSSPSSQLYIVYFSLSFWAYKSSIWYATLLLFSFIALTCYIATLLWYATLLLFSCIALICYIVTLFWYATLPLCFDMLHCHIALTSYIETLLWHCFCSSTLWSIWMHTTLLSDESGLSETSLAMWTNIIVLLRFQHRTTWSR